MNAPWPSDGISAADEPLCDPFGWANEGRKRVQKNHKDFKCLVTEANTFLKAGAVRTAASMAEIAALQAVTSPPGLFASAKLDALLEEIGTREVGGDPALPARAHGGTRRVLHVATTVQTIGGHGRMIWRWIENDTASVHSVALTSQTNPVPGPLTDAVEKSGGRLTKLPGAPSRMIEKAQALQALASKADVVILHVGNRDIVPVLAFADRRDRPPVLYLDHADHLFWLGASLWDGVITLRESGRRLAIERRGIVPQRTLLLPIPIEPLANQTPREEAKRRLGLERDGLVLLSVARSLKYRTVDGQTYADAHLPFLLAHPDAILIVLGSGARLDWSGANRATGGRILMLPETNETADYYDAADIYVDSFPFVSTTSMIEAALRGVPVVTRRPFGAACAILGCDVPGLDAHMLQADTSKEYTRLLSRLAADPAERSRIGIRTRDTLLAMHAGDGWKAHLEKIYRFSQRADLAQLPASRASREANFDAPDIHVAMVHGRLSDPDKVLLGNLHLFPPGERLRLWLRLAQRQRSSKTSLRQLLRAYAPRRAKIQAWIR